MTDTNKEAVEQHIMRIDPHGYAQPKSLNDDTIRLLRALSAERDEWKRKAQDLALTELARLGQEEEHRDMTRPGDTIHET